MLSKLHSRLGTAGFVVAIVALVAAVAGTAIAATGLNSKQKKEVKSIAKSFQGKGPAGPQGPAGAAGPKGADGAQGPAGKDGAGVTTAPADAGECAEGGVKITTGNGVSTAVCNGEEGDAGEPGQSGFTKTLPPGETETGVWTLSETVAPENGGSAVVPLSFPIPLAEKIPGEQSHYVSKDGNEFLFDLETEDIVLRVSTVCTGSAANPTAPPGHLCVYTSDAGLGGNATSGQSNFVNPETGNRGLNGDGITTAVSGALLLFDIPPGSVASGAGTWAVTACPEGDCTP
jgi:hypothetical protein